MKKKCYIYILCFYGNAGGRIQSGGTERKADEVCGVQEMEVVRGIL